MIHFSVLIRNKKTKVETLYIADQIEFDEKEGLYLYQRCYGDSIPSQHFMLSEKEEDYRDVFIMNESGQTITRYFL